MLRFAFLLAAALAAQPAGAAPAADPAAVARIHGGIVTVPSASFRAPI